MYIPESVKCDVCDTVQIKTNGWYTVRVIDWEEEKKLEILQFQDKDAKDFPALCGDNCLGKFISQKAQLLHPREEK